MSLVGFKAQNHPQQQVSDEVDDRGTHPDYFLPWDERFHFTLDVAAAPHNAKCQRYFTRADDGLLQSWYGERVWCNPPYSDIGAWVAKAWKEWHGRKVPLIVMLVPANRTEQRWWQQLVEPYRDGRRPSDLRVEFLPGRMRFIRPNAVIGPKGDRPPFGCCLLIWDRSRALETSTPEAIGSTSRRSAPSPHQTTFPGEATVLSGVAPLGARHGAQACSCDSGLTVAECEAMRPYAWPVRS